MCTCTSCKYTNSFDKGFASWPQGNPAGKRASMASYAAHVAHGKLTSDRAIPDGYRKLHAEPVFPAWIAGDNGLPARNMAAIRWNGEARSINP